MNIRFVRLVKYLSATLILYFLFLHKQEESLTTLPKGFRFSQYLLSNSDIFIPVKRSENRSEETSSPQPSSMSSTSASTVSSVLSYDEDQLEDQPTGRNMTDQDVIENTQAFLVENKQRLENIRFSVVSPSSVLKRIIFSACIAEVLSKVSMR